MIYLVLDNIRSAWNVGALIRTCDGAGAEIILLGYTPKPVGETKKLIIKTSIGAEETVKWQHFDTYRQFLDKYNTKDNIHLGIEINSKSCSLYELLENKFNIETFKNAENIFLWLGNEIHGLNEVLEDELYGFFHFPMLGKKESLNVSSTGAIALYMFNFVLQR